MSNSKESRPARNYWDFIALKPDGNLGYTDYPDEQHGGIGADNLRLMHTRNHFIQKEVRQAQKFTFRRKFPQSLGLRIFAWLAVAKTELYGRENLDFVQERLGSQQFTFAARHASDADHQAMDHVLRRGGYPRIANSLRFVAGLKMWDRPETRPFMPALETMPVPAPGYFDDAEKMFNLAKTEEGKDLVKGYIAAMEWLGKTSFVANAREWKRGKVIEVMYPETTRSRVDLLEEGRQETEVYYRSGLIVPIMSEGVADGFPVGGGPDWKRILKRRLVLRFWVGQPIDAKVLQSAEVISWLQERGARPVDFVTSRIGVQNPDRVHPIHRSLIEKLWDDIPEGLLVNTTA